MKSKEPIFLKWDWHLVIVLFLAMIFLLLINFLNYLPVSDNQSNNNRLLFNSPDETAYYWAAHNYYHQQSFMVFSDPSLVAGDLVAPRSLRIVNNYLVPTGFVGLSYLAGNFARILHSEHWILLFSSLITTISLVLFYLFIKKIYGPRVGLISVALLMVTPAFFYYASRPMVPNILVCSFLMIGLFLSQLGISKKNNLTILAAGLFFGLSILVRPSELIWIGPLLLILYLANIKSLPFSRIMLLIPTFFLALLPFFYFNIIQFGSPLNIGYSITSSVTNLDQDIFLKYLLPFGFNVVNILVNARNYLSLIFSWQSTFFILALWPILLSIFNKHNKLQKKNLIILLIIIVTSILVVVYYGSWKFSDNPNPRAITIGTSYVRYWLPVYILMSVMVALGIRLFTKRSLIATYLIFSSVFIIWCNYGYQTVYTNPQEGLKVISQNLIEYQKISQLVLSNTDKEDIIISGRNDKIFFPARHVIYNLFYDIDYQRIAPLLKNHSVYWWSAKYTDQDLQYLNSKYQKYQWQLERTPINWQKMTLYQIKNYAQPQVD